MCQRNSQNFGKVYVSLPLGKGELKHYFLDCLQLKMKAGNSSGTQEFQHSFVVTISILWNIDSEAIELVLRRLFCNLYWRVCIL